MRLVFRFMDWSMESLPRFLAVYIGLTVLGSTPLIILSLIYGWSGD